MLYITTKEHPVSGDQMRKQIKTDLAKMSVVFIKSSHLKHIRTQDRVNSVHSTHVHLTTDSPI